MGIEPTTLGLKGHVGLSHGVASVRKRSPRLDKSRAMIPRVIRFWHRLRSRLLDRLLTVRQIAAFLRPSTRTVYMLCDEGRLAHVRIANAIRVEPAALVALVRSRTE